MKHLLCKTPLKTALVALVHLVCIRSGLAQLPNPDSGAQGGDSAGVGAKQEFVHAVQAGGALPEAEIARQIATGDMTPWSKVAEGQPKERQTLLARGLYEFMKERGVNWAGRLEPGSAAEFPGLGVLFLKDFLEAPEMVLPANKDFGWQTIETLVLSRKFKCAQALMKLADTQSFQALWQAFPNLSESDQRIVARVFPESKALSQWEAIQKATLAAKSEDVRSDLTDAKNTLVTRALQNNEGVPEALAAADALMAAGEARDYLVEELKKRPARPASDRAANEK